MDWTKVTHEAILPLHRDKIYSSRDLESKGFWECSVFEWDIIQSKRAEVVEQERAEKEDSKGIRRRLYAEGALTNTNGRGYKPTGGSRRGRPAKRGSRKSA